MNLLIMGLPGAGKGTQAEQIVDTFGILQIATGDIFRRAIENKTELGQKAQAFIDRGELVPDEVTNGIVKERLQEKDVASGFLLDGFPRTLAQALALGEMLEDLGKKIDRVLNIQVSSKLLVDRLSGRFICRDCGATYHKINHPPKVSGVCDRCGSSNFYQRDDDQPETVKNRLKVNIEQSQPIIEFYQKQGLLVNIDGEQSINDVFAEIKKVLSDK
jgi:adenylate kinase